MIVVMTRAAVSLLGVAVVALLACERTPTQPPGSADEVASTQTQPPIDPEDEPWDDEDERGDSSFDLDRDEDVEAEVVAEAAPVTDSNTVEVISFDESDPNPGPTDFVRVPPDRTPSGSLLKPGMLSGPK